MTAEEIQKLPIETEVDGNAIMRELAVQLARANEFKDQEHSTRIADQIGNRIPGSHLYSLFYESGGSRERRVRAFSAEDALVIFRQDYPQMARFCRIGLAQNQNDTEGDFAYTYKGPVVVLDTKNHEA